MATAAPATATATAAAETQNGQQARHQEVGHKSLLQSDALYQVHCRETQVQFSNLVTAHLAFGLRFPPKKNCHSICDRTFVTYPLN